MKNILKKLLPGYFERKQSTSINQWLNGQYSGGSDQLINNAQLQIELGYKSIVWVYACINKIAESASRIDYKLFRTLANGEREEVKNHWSLDLLKKPNDITTGMEMSFAFHAYKLITGNGYILKGGGDSDGFGSITGRPLNLLNLMSQNVTPKLTSSNDLVYDWVSDNGLKVLPKEQVMHLKGFNPTSQIKGLSIIEVLRRTIETNNKAKIWNENLMSNDARPSGMLNIKSQVSLPERKRLMKALKDEFLGSVNAGLPFLGVGDMEFKPFAMSPKDLDWVMQTKLSINEIATAFNVPVQLINQEEGKTFANYEQAVKSFYLDNIIPAREQELQIYSNSLLANEPTLNYAIDYADIPQIQENVNDLWTRINASPELTYNERLRLKGLEESTDPNADVRFVPNNWTPIDLLGSDENTE